MSEKPKLIVFDLDYTLWPFWVDTHVDGPFTRKRNGTVYDVHGKKVTFYPDVPEMLHELHQKNYALGLASRTSSTSEANDLVKLFNWDKYFEYREIYPGSKVTHFKRFHEKSGFAYFDMLFFDDEHRNMVDVGRLGVTCVLARDGMSKDVLEKGLREFAEKKNN